MADLTITATQVLATDSTETISGILAVAATAGQMVYRYDNRFLLADANFSPQAAQEVGLLLNGGGIGQTVQVAVDGDVILGAGAAPGKGTIYVLSATAGGIAPVADLAAGWYRTILGCGDDNNVLVLNISAFGIVP